MPYTPRLIGARPLDNGRLALAFWNEKTKQEEVLVADIWGAFMDRRLSPLWESLFSKLYNETLFNSLYLYDGNVCWPFGLELSYLELYSASEIAKDGFQCLK